MNTSIPARALAPICLLLLVPGVARSLDRPSTLVLRAYPQRMADRYTTRDGLPGKRVTGIAADGKAIRAQTEAGPATFADGRWRAGGEALPPTFPFVEAKKLPAGAAVLSAAQGPDGRVWIVTKEGAFRSEGNRYVPFPFPT